MDKYKVGPEAAKGTSRPSQLASTKTKQTKTWQRQNMDWLAEEAFNNANVTSRRKTREEIKRNWDLVHGISSHEDLLNTFDPARVADGEPDQIPFGFESFNPIKGPVTTLFNEELSRRSEIRAVAINPEVLGQKDMEFRSKLLEHLQGLEQGLEQYKADEKGVAEMLAKIDYWRKYEQQSAHEVMANQVLNYVAKDVNINVGYVFQKGIQEKFIAGESCYRIGSIGDEFRIFNVIPSQFVVLGMGSSERIEDGNAWIEWAYTPVDDIVAEFPKLTRREIENLYSTSDTFGSEWGVFEKFDGMVVANNADSMTVEGNYTGSDDTLRTNTVDSAGNVLVVRAQWVSHRKLGILHSFDGEDNEIETFVDEYYVPDETKGEWLEWMYVNEIWEGVKIGDDLYQNIGPARTQMRSLVNPAIVRPCYVGSIVTLGKIHKAVSIVDELAPLVREYNLWANKLRQLWVRHIGPVLRIHKSRIPIELGFDAYIKLLKVAGISYEDDFREGPSGQMAGQMQAQNPTMSVDVARDIKIAIDTMDWIKQQIREAVAVPDVRDGNLTGREVATTSQQALVGATTKTHHYFRLHEQDKLRVYTVALEYIKDLWGENPKQMQYILDDMSSYILNYDGKLMSEAECGVVLTDSTAMQRLEQDIINMGQAFAQNGTINFSDMVSLRLANSASEMRRQIEAAEEKVASQREAAEQAAHERQLQLLEQQDATLQRAHERKIAEIEAEQNAMADRELAKERMRLEYQYKMATDTRMADENNDGIVDDVEVKKAQIAADAVLEKARMDDATKREALQVKREEIKIKKSEPKTKK